MLSTKTGDERRATFARSPSLFALRLHGADDDDDSDDEDEDDDGDGDVDEEDGGDDDDWRLTIEN